IQDLRFDDSRIISGGKHEDENLQSSLKRFILPNSVQEKGKVTLYALPSSLILRYLPPLYSVCNLFQIHKMLINATQDDT
ncbi:hypothetical protein J6590_105479, partial [Homalodisca vitripennis]